MDAPSLYDTDILAWSEQQAAVLRALAARADRPNDLDIDNVAEEIEAVGRSQLNAAESRLRLILSHLVKAVSDPASPALGHWRTECATWQGDLLQAVSPSMHQRLDLDRAWRRARREAALALAEHGLQPHSELPAECPLTLLDLLDEEFDLLDAAARLRAKLAPSP